MEDKLLQALEKTSSNIDYIDLRYQRAYGTTINIVDSTSKIAEFIDYGVSVRALYRKSWAHIFTPKATLDGLIDAINIASKLAKKINGRFRRKCNSALNPPSHGPIYGEKTTFQKIPLQNVSMDEKIKSLMEIDTDLKEYGPQIINRNIAYTEEFEDVIFCNSIGSFLKSHNCYVMLGVYCYAKNGENSQFSYESLGGAGGYELIKTGLVQNIGKKVASEASQMLSAKSSPCGKLTCVLDPEIGGMFIHECFGHACEADNILSGVSLFEGKIGKKVASESVTVIDDGTKFPLYGSIHFDDEGIAPKRNILIQDGVLLGYLHSMETSSKMNLIPTGNARAESYRFPPLVRSTNIFVSPRDYTLDEMLEEAKRGLLCQGVQYGYVDTSQGHFTFKCKRAYIIKKGEITEPVKDVSISGRVSETANKIKCIGKDLSFLSGYCGKEGQRVRVSMGSPHLLIKDLIVGGLE